MNMDTLSSFETIDMCSECAAIAPAAGLPDERFVASIDQTANLFEEIPAQQMALAVGGYGWSPNQKPPAILNTHPLSAKDQAKLQQAVGQGVIWGAGGAIATAIVPGGAPFAPAAGAIGFATGFVSSLFSSYGPGSS